MSKSNTIVCQKCGGTGHRQLSRPYLECVGNIQKLGEPTMRELHEASGGGLLTTATHKRVMRLAEWGVVKIIEGRPQRVKLARS